MSIIKKIFNWFIAIALGLNVCHAADGPDQITSNCQENRNYSELYSEISKGNCLSLIYFVQCRKNYQGGDLGDLYRASGNFILTKPDMYLFILERESVSEKELENFLVMLPLDTVDDVERKRIEIRNRLESVKAVKDSNIKNMAISIFEKELNFLSSLPSLR